jgi:hypothetical protein
MSIIRHVHGASNTGGVYGFFRNAEIKKQTVYATVCDFDYLIGDQTV